MDKVKINNQVISMRKVIKQVKIHAIHKISRQVKLLMARKGPEEKLAKSKRKLERLLELISCLKKCQPDPVSKHALMKTKKWADVLANKNIAVEEKCVAILANHPLVKESVRKFHEENSELVPNIATLIKQMEEKQKVAKKERNGKPAESHLTGANLIKPGQQNEFSTNKKEPKADLLLKDEKLQDIGCRLLEKSMLNTKLHDAYKTSNQKLQHIKKTAIKESDVNKNSRSEMAPLVEDNDENRDRNKQIKINNPSKTDLNVMKLNQFHQKLIKDSNFEKKKKKFSKKIDHNVIDTQIINSQAESDCESMAEENPDDFDREEVEEEEVGVISLQNAASFKNSSNINQYVLMSDSESSIEKNSVGSDGVLGEEVSMMSLENAVTLKNNTYTDKSVPKNKLKAVALLDLNELHDLDEIPVESANDSDEEEVIQDLKKQKKDSFFLRGGEVNSSSDEEDDKAKETTRNYSSFKKKPFDKFTGRKSSNDNSFKKKDFRQSSGHGFKPNFKKNDYQQNREFSFKDSRNNFKRKFGPDSEYRPNKNFKDPKGKSFGQKFSKDSKKTISHHNPSNSPAEPPLHPSWEAKKKFSAPVKFSGKRVVYEL
ncbi:uncharacterized protein CDAR_25331 [Caerostris darwini]|uniref:Serum response factor-binding protein 1 n=1 Tax=Caerostris darwini TaxID=1538125 RepID=A0AAV4T6F7_9ARAC|nr:uncharacterized protein CDAR_25331 [Caerostris darwini]